VSCTECRDVFKAGIQACKDSQQARQATPKSPSCGWQSQMFCSALVKARARADADAKGTPAAADDVLRTTGLQSAPRQLPLARSSCRLRPVQQRVCVGGPVRCAMHASQKTTPSTAHAAMS
jgi:hypothetical protein